MALGMKFACVCLALLCAGANAWGRGRSKRSAFVQGKRAGVARENPGIGYNEMKQTNKDNDKDVAEYKVSSEKANKQAKVAEEKGDEYMRDLKSLTAGHHTIETGIKHLHDVVEDANQKSLKKIQEVLKTAEEKKKAAAKAGEHHEHEEPPKGN
uniref:Uncharacterized protein n=1 Tax=Alexandrium andersonii TaxID=327968 RepID=A0A7S2N3N4_9DINO|mmetsp:Transcript_83062/g.185411  ORF Transcript_83062/g.185411 Transcript_83062/m.185411 type:complete len:154 (+) Transcript_83062:78-539(+)